MVDVVVEGKTVTFEEEAVLQRRMKKVVLGVKAFPDIEGLQF